MVQQAKITQSRVRSVLQYDSFWELPYKLQLDENICPITARHRWPTETCQSRQSLALDCHQHLNNAAYFKPSSRSIILDVLEVTVSALILIDEEKDLAFAQLRSHFKTKSELIEPVLPQASIFTNFTTHSQRCTSSRNLIKDTPLVNQSGKRQMEEVERRR